MSPWVFRPLELVERLNGAGVRFVIVGGLAVAAYGYIRGTKDLDIVPDPDLENLERLAAVLEELDGRVVVEGRNLDKPAIRTFLRAGDKTVVRTDRPLDRVDIEALEIAHGEETEEEHEG